jgi:pilus assembly protein Flp/PilA
MASRYPSVYRQQMGLFFKRGGTSRFFNEKGGSELLQMLSRLWHEEDGQGMVEYALIIALIAIVVIAALTGLGDKVKELFGKASKGIENAPTE